MDLMSGLFSECEDVRFDIFLRLYHYFISGNFAAFDNDIPGTKGFVVLTRFFCKPVPLEGIGSENENVFPTVSGNMLPFYYEKNCGATAEAIGERLRSIRTTIGLTLDSMSEKLSSSRSGYRKMEIGEAFPNGQTLFLLHDEFGVDIVWLLYGRHSTHSDILRYLRNEDECVKFDIFVRLYSYFSTKEQASLVPFHDCCEGVEHFAKFGNDGLYTIL